MYQPSDSLLWAVAVSSNQILYEGKKILVYVESYKEGK